MPGVPQVGSWSRHWDPSTELYFYYEGCSGLTTWDAPNPPEPPNLRELVEDKDRRDRRHVQLPARRVREPPDGMHRRESRRNRPRPQKNRLAPLKGAPLKSAPRNRRRQYQESKDEDDDNPRKDYLKLADEYSITAPFRETGGNQTCVLCQTRKASDVFFPCEHKSVCGRCSRAEGFGEEESDGGGGQLCPVCCQQVVFVVPYKGGDEADEYWRWVQEVKPPLPRGFRHKFHRAAIMLKIKSEPDSHKTWDRPEASACCVLS
ncbi:unnamed protein product [Laminaria digitata]